MKMHLFGRVLETTVWAASLCLASPTSLELPTLSSKSTDLMIQRGIELAQARGLEKRLSADFPMARSWKNEVLFGGSWTDIQTDASANTALNIECIDCYTKGTVTARLWEDIFHPTVKLEFNQVEAYVHLGIQTNASGVFSINLFASQSPIGFGFPGLSVGVVFFVDLVFSLSAQIDLTGGFRVKLADGAFLEADIFGGAVKDSFFDGIQSSSIPVTVQSGTAVFKADLRLRVQCGAETTLDMIGIGSGAVVGVYANIIEFVAVIDSTPSCALETREWWDLNVGAYAHLDVVVDYKTLGPVPTVSTTLLLAPTMTQCWISATNAPSVAAAFKASLPNIQLTSALPPVVTRTPSQPGPAVVTIPSASITRLPRPSTTNSTAVTKSGFYLQNSSLPITSSVGMVTSTAIATAVYTLTRCAASVVNCPESYQSQVVVTQTMDLFTTICPATAQITAAPAKPTTVTGTDVVIAGSAAAEHVVVLERVATPIVRTFSPQTATETQALLQVTAAATDIADLKGGSQTTTSFSNTATTAILSTAAAPVNGSYVDLSSHVVATAGTKSNRNPRAITRVIAGVTGLLVVLG